MTDERRPDPDALLAAIQKHEARAERGKLKIFFGMAAGVGKTYAMLEAAHEAKAAGVDVVVGYVVTHGRAETEALLLDLEHVPRVQVEYRGTVLEEMDLDALLARRPQLALVDELAHTNAPGVRHAKRYQDVLELLEAGIDVYTTVNVQHFESRADAVRQITGVTVHETVPDSILDLADEIELIDLTPEELRKRLAEGKVYTPERVETAAHNFFRTGNLTALREMALRLTAEHVDHQLQDYMDLKRIALEANGYRVYEVDNGRDAIQEAARLRPDLVILDMGLPDIEGLVVLERLREWLPTPVIILSVRDADRDKVAALDAGADDYLTKPFSLEELMARMRVAQRHAQPGPQSTVFVCGNVTVDLAHRQVTKRGEPVRLTPTEYALLRLLIQHAGRVLTHKQILKEVWGPDYVEETHYLRVYFAQLRQKLEDDPALPRLIVTEPGVGYRLAVS